MLWNNFWFSFIQLFWKKVKHWSFCFIYFGRFVVEIKLKKQFLTQKAFFKKNKIFLIIENIFFSKFRFMTIKSSMLRLSAQNNSDQHSGDTHTMLMLQSIHQVFRYSPKQYISKYFKSSLLFKKSLWFHSNFKNCHFSSEDYELLPWILLGRLVVSNNNCHIS